MRLGAFALREVASATGTMSTIRFFPERAW